MTVRDSSINRQADSSNGDAGSFEPKRRLSPVMKFILLFLLNLVVLGAAYAHLTASYHDSIVPLMHATAHIVGFVLSVFSSSVSYDGAHCILQGFAVEIIDECTGLLEMVIFLSAVVSFGATGRKKALGLLLGIPAIYMFNLVRIIVLIVVGAYWPGAFNFMHIYFWQVTLILMIGSVWVGWLYLVVYREEKPVAVPS